MTKDIRKDLILIKPLLKKALKLVSLLPFILTGCEEKKSVETLGETEHYFDEKVTSISSGNGGIAWVGSETGRIWQVTGCSSKPFDVGSERIYKVMQEDYSPFLWIAIRNSGLQKWSMSENENLQKLKTYKIPVKGNQYSAYDILKFRDTLFAATTQGLYRLSVKADCDSMTLVYPESANLYNRYNNSFPVKNMCICDDVFLWASTDHGALCVNLSDGRTALHYPDIPISHVSFQNDTLFILKENMLVKCKPDGTYLDSVSLQFNPKVYFQTDGMHYLIDRDNMLISRNLRDFTMIPLRKKISDKCRNVIMSDPDSDFLLLLMEDALWRIPRHNGVFSGNRYVKIACEDDKQIYYLSSDNRLYLQRNAENAIPVFSFPQEEQIVWMCASEDKIYYYNTEQEVKELSVSASPLKNYFMHNSRILYHSRHKITSACLTDKEKTPKLYLGIQDGLLLLDLHSGKVKELSDFSNRYVTSFFIPQHSKRLYLSTLNNGIYYSSCDTVFMSISDTKSHSSVKDLIVTGSYPQQLISLTNHDILSHKSADSVLLRGCSKLLYVNDTLFYALSESGIHKMLIDSSGALQDKGSYYTDIRFNPAASFVKGQKLYLGSDVGVLVLDAENPDSMKWILFESDTLLSVRNIILLSGFILIGLILFFYRHVRRRKLARQQLQKRIAHLSHCIEELQSFYYLTDENEQKQIEMLKNEIDEIDPNTHNRKRLHITIKRLTDEIIKKNRDVSLRLLKALDNQIICLSGYDAKERFKLIEASNEVLKSNNIESIKTQLNSNEKWINDFSSLEKGLRAFNEEIPGVISIDHATQNLKLNLVCLNEGINSKPLAEMMELYRSVKQDYDQLFTDKILELTLGQADCMIQYLRQHKKEDWVSHILIDEIEITKLMTDPKQRIKLLSELELINKRIEIIRIKDQMENCIESYTILRDKIVDENDRLINKKFDKELEHDIAVQTRGLVDTLEKLTVSFYKVLQTTDPFILNDVLKISSYYHQQAKVLAILIANPRVKRSLIPAMLGIYGNLNPVISRLINSKIKSNEELLRNYLEQSPLNSVFVYYVLKLID